MCGNGLFHPEPAHNLATALDLAISQILFPRAVDAIRDLTTLRERLGDVLTSRFPRSAAFLVARDVFTQRAAEAQP